MKPLTEYTQDATTKLLEETGAFFAFGQDQYEAEAVEGVKYASLNAGLICPVDNVKLLRMGLDSITKAAIILRKEEHTDEEIIKYELDNHEAIVTLSIEDTVESLKGYDYTVEQIEKVFNKYILSRC